MKKVEEVATEKVGAQVDLDMVQTQTMEVSVHAIEGAHSNQTNYDVEPIYDEEPREGQVCWIEKEFILAALKEGNSKPSNPLQSALCICERLEVDDLRNRPTKILEGGDKPKLVDYTGEEQQGTVEGENSIILTNMREELIEEVLSRDGQTVAKFSGLDKSSSHLENKNMIIFDPGGLVQDHSKGANHNSKDMSRSEMQLEEAVMEDSIGSKLWHWQAFDFLEIEQQLLKEPSQLQRKVFIIETKISAREESQNVQKESDWFDKIVCEINQQYVDSVRTGMIVLPYKYKSMVLEQGRPEFDNSMTPEYYEGSKKSITMYIFDPGGDLVCHHGVLLVVSAGIPKFEQLLQAVFKGKDLYTKGKERTGIEPLSRMSEGWPEAIKIMFSWQP